MYGKLKTCPSSFVVTAYERQQIKVAVVTGQRRPAINRRAGEQRPG
jgi:hypothetical protein